MMSLPVPDRRIANNASRRNVNVCKAVVPLARLKQDRLPGSQRQGINAGSVPGTSILLNSFCGAGANLHQTVRTRLGKRD
jgi:hypothetical protein